jgi:stearoyl-CoA desaturase (delta-9 desaturase)
MSQHIMPDAERNAKVTPYSVARRMRFERFRLWLSISMVLFATLGAVAAVALSFWHPPGRLELLLLGGMWLWTQGLGSIAYHRYFTHHAFEPSFILKIVLAVAGSMWFQGPVVYWVVVHRRHHECSDGEGDPHSPQPEKHSWTARLRGFWHGHIGWLAGHDLPNPLHYAPDLLKDRMVMWFNHHYLLFAVGGLLLPSAIALALCHPWDVVLSCFLWGGAVRLFLCYNLTWSINSFCHLLGRRDNPTCDESRNIGILALLTFGESWHNNHHQSPSTACFGRRWSQIDPGYLVIRLFACMGLAHQVRGMPSRLS